MSAPDPGRTARTMTGWAVGLAVLGAVCCGGGAWVGAAALSARADEAAARLARREAVERERGSCADLLAALGDAVRAGAAELPANLPEAAPKDPWGRPVRWRRTSGARGTLSSAGPDGDFGTADDVTHEVTIE